MPTAATSCSRAIRRNVFTISDALNSVDPKPAEWLDKDFFKVEKPNYDFLCLHQRLQFVEALTRESESAPWVLAGLKPGEVLDTNKVSSLSSTLNYPSFVDVSADQSARCDRAGKAVDCDD